MVSILTRWIDIKIKIISQYILLLIKASASKEWIIIRWHQPRFTIISVWRTWFLLGEEAEDAFRLKRDWIRIIFKHSGLSEGRGVIFYYSSIINYDRRKQAVINP